MTAAVLVAAGIALLAVLLLAGAPGPAPRGRFGGRRGRRPPAARRRGARPGIPTTNEESVADDMAPSRSDDL